MIRIEYNGTLTAGYYNAMEAGYPVFISGETLSNIVKDRLREYGIDDNFCYKPGEMPEDVDHPLIGRRVKLILEIDG